MMDITEIETLKKATLGFEKCQFLQIGTASGVTAFAIIETIKSVGGHLFTVDIDESPGGGTFRDPKTRNNGFWADVQEKELEDAIDYFRNGSDDFFKKNEEWDGKFDIIFVDGDHRYEQSKKDLGNAMKAIKPNGIIYLHDVMDRTQGLGRRHTVARVFDEFEKEGWKKKLYNTPFKLAKIWREE
jgi:predicted O-methyltransferase YrrM